MCIKHFEDKMLWLFFSWKCWKPFQLSNSSCARIQKVGPIISPIRSMTDNINHFDSKSRAIFLSFMKQYFLEFFLYDSQTFHAQTRQGLFPLKVLHIITGRLHLSFWFSLYHCRFHPLWDHIFQIKWPAGEKLSSVLNFKLPASRSDQEFLLDFQLQKIDRCTTLATFGNSYIRHRHQK